MELDAPALSPTSDKDALKANSYYDANIKINSTISWFKTFRKFIGPGYMIAVGYMDPGNWATDLSAGSLVSLKEIILVSL